MQYSRGKEVQIYELTDQGRDDIKSCTKVGVQVAISF
jgi:hypothetical protein